MRNVCPDCEKNLVPRLHPKFRDSVVCLHQIEKMAPSELNAMFPAAAGVFREVALKHITQREAVSDVRQVQ